MEFQSDVNVGGPDGDPPYCTVGTVILPYDGALSRRWLWDRLDEIRTEYERKYHGDE